MNKNGQIKKWSRILILANLFLFIAIPLLLADMIWYDPSAANAENLQTYATYKTDLGDDKLITDPGYSFVLSQVYISANASTSDTVLLIFNQDVYNDLLDDNYEGGSIPGRPDALLGRYFYHLEREFGIIVCTYDGLMDIDTSTIPYDRDISPSDQMRDQIITRYQHPGTYGNLVGTIFIGELPSKWYRYQEFIDGIPVWIEFPMDLYFMDMDRNLDTEVDNWVIDEGNQGLLIGYTDTINTIKPEIWVGRMTASTLYNDEIPIIRRYLNKNISYRESVDLQEDMALVYDGDNNIPLDANNTNPWIDILKNEIYDSEDDVDLFRSSNRNHALSFLRRITAPDADTGRDSIQKYELVHFGITSSAFTHTFEPYNDADYKHLTGNDIKDTSTILNRQDDLDILPPFYVIAGAGAARFTANNYIGGYYIFDSVDDISKRNGLTLVGSTKSKGMRDAEDFYTRLRIRCFGESLWYWINQSDLNDFSDFNGMTIIGDPTLKLIDEEIKAIEDGLRFISTSSRVRDGRGEITGEEISSGYRPAIASLAALPYLNWGETSNQIVVNLIDRITTPQANGGWLVENEAGNYAYISAGRGEGVGVYNTSCAILPLAAHPSTTAGTPETNDRYRQILERLRNYLVRCQRSNRGFGYSLSSISDNSNSQFALMGIYMATYKLNNKTIPNNIQTTVFDPCVTYWLNVTTRNTSGGGHGYRNGSEIPTMTAAAAWNYLLCKPDQPELSDGDFNRLPALMGNDPYNIGNANNGRCYYYAWSLAKACAMRKKTFPIAGDTRDWYDALAQSLKGYQNQITGEWTRSPLLNVNNGGVEFSTLLAILSLQTQKLNDNDNVYKAYILKSYADLHLYNSTGRLHTGINYTANKIENQIPGSRFIIYRKDDPLKTEISYEDALNEYDNIGEEYAQEILVWMPIPGRYRIEIVGNSNANHTTETPEYQLTVETIKNDKIVSSKPFDPKQIAGPDANGNPEVHAAFDTIAIIDGELPEYTEEPELSAVMKIDPESIEADVDPDTQTAEFDILVMETSDEKALNTVTAYCSNFKDADGDSDITGSSSFFTYPDGHDILKGNQITIQVKIPVPDGFDGPGTGTIIIESAEGIAKTAPVTINTNLPPIANAGPNQIVYAGMTGTPTAMVTLDGSGSSDPDGDTLTYTWYKEDGSSLAIGMNPEVELPVGENSISLVVYDDKEFSEPAYVTITVIAAIDKDIIISPDKIYRNTRKYWIMTRTFLPEDIKRDDINMDYKAKLFTKDGESISAVGQYLLPRYHKNYNQMNNSSRCHVPDKLYLITWYRHRDITNLIPEDGVYELTQVCKLLSGEFLNGKDTVILLGKTMRATRLTIYPRVIQPDYLPNYVKTYITLPGDIKREDIDMDTTITLNTLTGESIQAIDQYFYPDKSKNAPDSRHHYPGKIKLIVHFAPEDLLKMLPEKGYYELYQECKLISGDILAGFGRINIHKPKPKQD